MFCFTVAVDARPSIATSTLGLRGRSLGSFLALGQGATHCFNKEINQANQANQVNQANIHKTEC